MFHERNLSNYPDVLTVSEIQSILGIGRNTAYKLINSGRLRCIWIGRTIRIPKSYLLDFLTYDGYNNIHDSYASDSQRKEGE